MNFLGLSMSAIAFVAAPICAVWAAVGYLLGRKQAKLARDPGRNFLEGRVARPDATWIRLE